MTKADAKDLNKQLQEALAALNAVYSELRCYTDLHGTDEDYENAIELAKEVLRKAGMLPSRGAYT